MLPWRPRRRPRSWRPLVEGFADGVDTGSSDGAGLVFIAVIVAVVLLPIIVVLAVFLVEWLLVLLVLPVATALRAWAGRPWQVVARQRGGAASSAGPVVDTPRRFARDVRGWRASARLIETVRAEIRATGTPRSLGAEPLRQRRASRASIIGRQRTSQESDESRSS